MRLSLCNEVLREYSFPRQCALAADLGYDGLEVAPFTLSDDPQRLPAARRSELRRIAGDHGVAITGLHWVMNVPQGLSITHEDPVIHDRTRDHILAMIELCADLGGRVIVHGSPDQRRVADASSPDRARAVAIEHFRMAGMVAGSAGITYCIEPLSPKLTALFNTVADAASVVDALSLPNLRTMLDTCAAADSESESADKVIDRWLPGGHIAHIHLNDRDRRAPGQGRDRFLAVLRMLRHLDYQGVMGVEPFRYEPDGLSAAAVAAGYLRGLTEALEEDETP